MGNCKDCKHWGVATDTHHVRTCRAVGEDGLPGVVVPTADYGYNAHLETGPSFGCVLFEAKETA